MVMDWDWFVLMVIVRIVKIERHHMKQIENISEQHWITNDSSICRCVFNKHLSAAGIIFSWSHYPGQKSEYPYRELKHQAHGTRDPTRGVIFDGAVCVNVSERISRDKSCVFVQKLYATDITGAVNHEQCNNHKHEVTYMIHANSIAK